MGQKVKISARGIYGNSKMIRHFSDSQLPSNAKETQKFKLPCDRERWTTAIVCNPRRKVIVGCWDLCGSDAKLVSLPRRRCGMGLPQNKLDPWSRKITEFLNMSIYLFI
jgi:hypothetical protein